MKSTLPLASPRSKKAAPKPFTFEQYAKRHRQAEVSPEGEQRACEKCTYRDGSSINECWMSKNR